MKKFIVAILAFFTLALAAEAQTETIVWEKDFKKAQAAARESGQPLMLDFTASWCKPCQEMEKTFWVQPDVVKLTKSFIAVKVDFDADTSTVKKYGVQAIPFVVFADPLGNLITFRRGFSPKNMDEINQIFNLMPKDFSSLKKYYDAVDLKKDDAPALLGIADFYRKSGIYSLSNEYYEKALKTPEVQSDAEKKERTAATLGSNAYAAQDYKQAADYLEDYLKDFPTGKYREFSIAVIAISSAKLDKKKAAVKYLETLKTEFPASKYLADVNTAVEVASAKSNK